MPPFAACLVLGSAPSVWPEVALPTAPSAAQHILQQKLKRDRLAAVETFAHRFTVQKTLLHWRHGATRKVTHRVKLADSLARRSARCLRSCWRMWAWHVEESNKLQQESRGPPAAVISL